MRGGGVDRPFMLPHFKVAGDAHPRLYKHVVIYYATVRIRMGYRVKPEPASRSTRTFAVRDHPRHRLHEPSCHMPSYHIHHASTVACGPGVPMHLHVIRIFRMYAIQLYASNTSPVCLRCHHAHASTHMPTEHNRARCTFVSPNPGTPV